MTLLICRTCPRYDPRATGEFGRRLTTALVQITEDEPDSSVAVRNVQTFFGERPANWEVRLADVAEHPAEEVVDRVMLDMHAPWEALPAVSAALRPGGVLLGYVATTTQLSRLVE